MTDSGLSIAEFLDYGKGCGLSANTIKRNEYLLTRFRRWLNGKDMREVDRNTVCAYREYLATYTSRFTGRVLRPASIGLHKHTQRLFRFPHPA